MHVRMHESMPDVLTDAAEDVLLLCAEVAPAMAARTTAFLKSMTTEMRGSREERLRTLGDSSALFYTGTGSNDIDTPHDHMLPHYKLLLVLQLYYISNAFIFYAANPKSLARLSHSDFSASSTAS